MVACKQDLLLQISTQRRGLTTDKTFEADGAPKKISNHVTGLGGFLGNRRPQRDWS